MVNFSIFIKKKLLSIQKILSFLIEILLFIYFLKWL